MSRCHWTVLAVLLLSVLFAPPTVGAREQPTQELPRVLVIATGGTIASSAGSARQLSGYRVALTGEDLVASVPGIEQVARITVEQFSNLPSTGLVPADWVRLAQRINVVLAEGLEDGTIVDGVVVTHGTDALEETAYFLSLTVRSRKPTVVVGAMRPASAISADGPLNLMNAVQVAVDPASRERGTLVVLNQEINAARDATKTNTLRVQTFRSRGWGVLGTVDPEGVVYQRRSEKRHSFKSEFDISALTPDSLPRIDIAYAYNGADGVGIRAFAVAGAQGIVIAGSGRGATPRGQGQAADEVAEQGIFVVRSSRTGSGSVGERGNLLAANDLAPQKARVLLMVSLTSTSDPEQIRRIFQTY